jgi:hypothetical protein
MFNGLAAQPSLLCQIVVGRPGVLGGGIAAHQEHDQFDQPLVEPGADAKAIGQRIGRFGDVGTVNPD